MKPRLGKFGPELLEGEVYPHLGFRSKSVVVGPGTGLDNAVIGLGRGRVEIVTTDPVSMVPALGMKSSAWLSVHLIASDYVTSGNRPEFATFVFNFPPDATEGETEEYLKCIGEECGKLGVAIVAGNTGRYPGSGYTVVGSGTFFGLADADGYLTPAMARPGDDVLVTKGAATEATAMLANCFPHYLERRLERASVEKAKGYLWKCSTVVDALAAAGAGLNEAVTSMHDATEGGVLGGISEMAAASGKAFDISLRDVPVTEESRAVCAAFSIDPLTSVSEGTLLITCRPDATESVSGRLRKRGVPCSKVGTVKEGPAGVWLSDGGRRRRFSQGVDPYWAAFERATMSGLD